MQKLKKKFTGVVVPMITPLTQHFLTDTGATEKILHTFLLSNVSPFLLGTTGESVSISDEQKHVLVKTAVHYVKSKVNVYAGISGNCLSESIEQGKAYADLGVDAVVAHLPFYYPLSPDQMLRYYETLANSVPCPLVLYNNPITTHYSIPLEVIEKLSYHSNIVGFKDSERGMERLDTALKLWSQRADFSHLTGWAAQSAYALLNGSDGIVPSTGNIVPALYQRLYETAVSSNEIKAMEIQKIADQISEIYQKDRNLSQAIPALKVMMASRGLCEPIVMPPLYELDKEDQKLIDEKTASFLLL